jgi:serine protease
VAITSTGGDAEVLVVADVASGAPEDIGTVTVVLRDATTRTIVARTTTTASEAYRYSFTDVPPGRYAIVATTDADGDGETCDVGEDCGAYPERNAPSTVTVVGGTTLRARDFGLSFVTSHADLVP